MRLSVVLTLMYENSFETRKSSCVNARGIPPAAYQVLAMLGGGVPHPRSGGVPHPRSGGYPIPGLRGVPCSRSGGVPSPMSGGYPIPGLGETPSQVWGVPCPARPQMGYPPWPDLEWGIPLPPDLRWGTPPAMVNRQTFPSINITFPRTTYAGGKNWHPTKMAIKRFPRGESEKSLVQRQKVSTS